jgi:hypothetical protein
MALTLLRLPFFIFVLTLDEMIFRVVEFGCDMVFLITRRCGCGTMTNVPCESLVCSKT